MIYTDDYRGYSGMPFAHRTVNHTARQYVRGPVWTNGIESVWATLKRGYRGTYHWMSPKHLDRYICEFNGRLNDRHADTLDQMSHMASGMVGKRLRYADLIALPVEPVEPANPAYIPPPGLVDALASALGTAGASPRLGEASPATVPLRAGQTLPLPLNGLQWHTPARDSNPRALTKGAKGGRQIPSRNQLSTVAHCLRSAFHYHWSEAGDSDALRSWRRDRGFPPESTGGTG